MFGDLKTKDEEGYDAEYASKVQLNEENMNIIVDTIFRKAQNEKEYCNFYGDICEKFIRLELGMRGMSATVK